MTEIAHSAFSLEQIRVARDERMRVDGAAETDDADEGDIDVDEGPPPKYPRGMLRFELTDGLTSIPAIEYRPLPSIILGVTSLGCKVSLSVRRQFLLSTLPGATQECENSKWHSLART